MAGVMQTGFTEQSIGAQIKYMGFKEAAANVWRNEHEGVTYGVDFGKQEIFKMDGFERVHEDAGDEYLAKIHSLVQLSTVNTDAPHVVEAEIVEEPEVEHVDARPARKEIPEEKHEDFVKAGLVEAKQTASTFLQQKRSESTNGFTPGIKGMTPQLCECGKIKIGKKGKTTTSQRGNSFRPPQKLDHFVVTTTAKTADDDFVEDVEIMDKLGQNCTEIPVMLLYDDPNLNFMTSLSYYDSAKCQCRGNGEVALKADGTMVDCDPETCKFAQNKKCKPNGILSVVLQDAPRVGGVWKFRSTGWNSIRNLMSSIEFIHGLTGGRLAGVPLMLTLQPKTTVIPGTKTTTTIYMVNIEYRGTMGELLSRAETRLTSSEQIAQIEAKAARMLALPESPEECKDVQEEFYPETMQEVA